MCVTRTVTMTVSVVHVTIVTVTVTCTLFRVHCGEEYKVKRSHTYITYYKSAAAVGGKQAGWHSRQNSSFPLQKWQP